MADTRITDLAVLTGTQIADADPFVVVDVSDLSMATSGTDKRIDFSEIVKAFQATGKFPEKILVSFTYTTPTPLDFGTLPAGKQIIDAQVVVDVPFDDAATLLSLGTVASPDTILPTNTIDPLVASTYQAEENFTIGSSTSARLKILPGTSTQGSGHVVIIFV